MSRTAFSKVVTANALIEGDVVYLAADGTWTRDLAQAQVHTDPTSAEIALAQGDAQSHLVVGCYLTDVRQTATGPQPAHFREEFRRLGPSNYAHGKQASAANAV